MFNTPQNQGIDDRLVISIRPVSRLIRHAPLTSPSPSPLKLETKPSPITNYTSLTASLMQAVKGPNKRKHVARRRKMLWVEEGRGKGQKAGP